MLAAMEPYADALGSVGMLAVAANLVGKLIALQDQRTMTPAMAMEIVAKNIEAANQRVIKELDNPPRRQGMREATMSDRCEPPEGTALWTLHELKQHGALGHMRWTGTHWRNGAIQMRREEMEHAGWRYVGPLTPMTPADKAVVDKAAAWRDDLYVRSVIFPDTLQVDALLSAIETARPYVAPDPVAETLTVVRASVGESAYGLRDAVRAYLKAIDARGAAP